MMAIEAFGIFEGGGAKGVAHIGALKALEERGVRFLGVAGTSAGAIIAALIAAGYRADELFRPASPEASLFHRHFPDFFPEEWKVLQRLRADGGRTFGGSAGPLALWLRSPGFCLRNRRALALLARHRGILCADRFAAWLEDALRRKLEERGLPVTGHGGRVAFRDLSLPLAVIATDTTARRIRVFSTWETPGAGVSEAVACSVSMPLVFRPRRGEGADLVDGGVVSNFPAWVLDEERRKAAPLTPTLGFRLVERGEAAGEGDPTLLRHARDLFFTALSGDDQLQVRRVENLAVVPLRVRASTLDFDLSHEAREELYRDGKECARDFLLAFAGPPDVDVLDGALMLAHEKMTGALGPRARHLRVNVMLPVGEECLRVIRGYNMAEDADDRLELPQDAGAAGVCWRTHDFVTCDLTEARRTHAARYRMDKYQQALVRPSLRALLCVPIFDHRRYDAARENHLNPLHGVLSFDSDEDLVTGFGAEGVRRTAAMCAGVMARCLVR